ncbi:MAG: LytTR family DNA-binding domain-containing protein, partial [Bacteroidota bacterium]
TPNPQCARQSSELDILDYLVKPIRMERYFKAVNKAQDYFALQQNQSADTSSEVGDDFIYVRADRKYVRIGFSDVLYIRGLKDYVVIHTHSARYSTAMNMKTIHAQLPEKIFARISKSYIVNVGQISAFDNEHVYVGDESLPIGKAFREAFKRVYVEGKLIGR